ncbi:MAG: hypothetical protein ACOCQ4_01170 [bacterium]
MKTEKNIVGISLHKPSNLDLESLIQAETMFLLPIRKSDGTFTYDMVRGSKIKKHIPTLYFFIHMFLDRQNQGVEPLQYLYDSSFVQMFARDIEPLKSKNYFRFIWSILRSLAVIEMVNSIKPNKYKESAQAYYFKIQEPYSSAEIVQHEILVPEKIKTKLDDLWNIGKNITKTNNTPKFSNPNIQHQVRALREINFENEAATKYIKKLYSKGNLSIAQYNSAIISINNLKNGRISTTHSHACNRLYTPITSLSKELRAFIKDDYGNELIELDFASFNPYVVYKILTGINPTYQSKLERIQFENELDLYSRLLLSGDFYQEINQLCFADKNFTRDEVKEVVLWKWFNARPNSRDKNRKIMLQKLPKISEIIDSMKSERFENFSNTTMKLESKLVNDLIYPEFIKRYPDALIYTIFDSYLVEERFAKELHQLMVERGSDFFGIDCIVRTK